MPARDAVLAALDAEDAEQFDAGAASRQSEVDAYAVRAEEAETEIDALDLQVSRLTSDLAALQSAYDAYRERNPEPTTYVGAAIQDNGDPSSLESGRTLGLHRTYWNYAKVAASITQANADVAAGRIPWLSYKLPGTWADAVAGKNDTATKALATKLAAVPGEVWVAIHHEPEGDGNLADWVKVQQRLLPLLAAAPNVRTSIILTAWDTFQSGNAAYSLSALWPGNMVSILGFDAYNPYGDANHPDKGWTEAKVYYDKIAPAAATLGVDWAIAETGYTDSAAARDADWLTRAYDDMVTAVKPGLGLCYFNSVANSIGSWSLGTGVKLEKFEQILGRSRVAA